MKTAYASTQRKIVVNGGSRCWIIMRTETCVHTRDRQMTKGALHQPNINLTSYLTTVLKRKCIAPTQFKWASLLKCHLKISDQNCPLIFKWPAKMRETPSLIERIVF